MESFEKRKRERKKQELRKEKAARKLQGLEAAGPSQADYFADLNEAPKVDAADTDEAQAGDDPKDAKATPPAQHGGGAAGAG